ncbi:MAG: prolyl oligopeptidase family serine peptidase [Proteobacteria bacterium]|nr:prolyl oligopeptidase family serine peptidase [Pseudomonadota bacterium]
MDLLRQAASAGSLLYCAALGAATTAPSVPAVDTHFGVAVPDPFRNLEDLKDPAVKQWLLAQGEAATQTLSRIEGRDALLQRIDALADAGGDVVREVTRRAGGRLFYLKRRAGEGQFKLVMRQGLGGAERVLVDPEQLAARSGGVPHAVNYFAPSWNGKLLAYGVSAGGSEQAELHLIDVASGRELRAPVPRVVEPHLAWSPGDRWLGFNQLRALPAGAPESEFYLDSAVLLIDARQPRRAPRAVFGPLVNPELRLDRLDVGGILFAPGSSWAVLRATDTTVPEGKVFVAPLAELDAPRPPRWRLLSTAADKVTDVQLRGRELLLRSYKAAPRGEVLALPLPAASLADARVVVPQPERGVLESFVPGRRAIYVELQQGFSVRVQRHDPARPAAAGVDVAPGLQGSTYAIVDPGAGADELWLDTSSWTAPARILSSAGGHLRDTGLRRNPPAAGVPELEALEVEVPSHDGVKVPLAVVHRKGLALDGRNPTLLDGYGAYGFTTQAWYDPRRYAWFERGGVLAFVNPRGSGAYGDDWHRAGFKATKPNTWKDGIAAARWLIEQGYATPATLGVEGGSAGGVFVGRAVTAAPELFAAAIFNVPVMDAVRFETTANGATNTSEFGSVAVEPEFKALLEMSTYHQIKDGTAYPAVLLVHGLNDPRVDVWHSAKAAARLQQASSSGKPILLRLDAQAGHGIGSTAQQRHAMQADEWAFLLWQFGRAGLKP